MRINQSLNSNEDVSIRSWFEIIKGWIYQSISITTNFAVSGENVIDLMESNELFVCRIPNYNLLCICSGWTCSFHQKYLFGAIVLNVDVFICLLPAFHFHASIVSALRWIVGKAIPLHSTYNLISRNWHNITLATIPI